MGGGKAKKLKSPKPEAGAGIPTCPSWAREEPSQSAPPPTAPHGSGETEAQVGAEAERGRPREADANPTLQKGNSLVEELCQAPLHPRGTYLGVEGLWLARLGLVVRGHGGLSCARMTWRTQRGWGGGGTAVRTLLGPRLSHLGDLGPQHCRPCLYLPGLRLP